MRPQSRVTVPFRLACRWRTSRSVKNAWRVGASRLIAGPPRRPGDDQRPRRAVRERPTDTSTCNLVARYRPIYPMTCGDVHSRRSFAFQARGLRAPVASSGTVYTRCGQVQPLEIGQSAAEFSDLLIRFEVSTSRVLADPVIPTVAGAGPTSRQPGV